ncbi:MAG: YihY/virulence factor BrkB family protein [Marmoricola sp.]
MARDKQHTNDSGADPTVHDEGAPEESAERDVAGETEFVTEETYRKRSAFYVLRKTGREFLDDRCTDLAAALTYYAVLAIFPAALALLSLLGVFNESGKALSTVLDVLRPLVSASTLQNIQGPLERLTTSQAAGWTFVVGLLGALWSASGYVGAFGRALNRIFEVEEGRPFWRLRPMNIVVTIVSIVLSAAVLLILVVSGPVARSVGNVIGLGDQAVTVFDIAKWPVLGLLVVVIVATLYYFTPNVKWPRFRILSIGAFVAILLWVIVSVGFAFYVANFSHYDRTYGSVAGVIVALLWLWLTNLALMFGAELDSEIERARELHLGKPAEEHLQVPLKSDRGIRKAEKRRAKDAENGREIRMMRVGSGDPADRPF